jgi:hypothetical protein
MKMIESLHLQQHYNLYNVAAGPPSSKPPIDHSNLPKRTQAGIYYAIVGDLSLEQFVAA